MAKENRGFGGMVQTDEGRIKQREIASKGGVAAHKKGTVHEWTADEARSAGRKGGQVSRGSRGRIAPVAAESAADPGQ
ncbi:MAG: stress-induced protein [Patescibacteria group bacterium]